MEIDKKILILNKIHNLSSNLERDGLKHIRDNCKWGLKKGKYGIHELTINDLRELADALELYMSDEFTLDDIQFYKE